MTAAEASSAGSQALEVFRIDRDGVWRHEDQEVTHPGVIQNLYANLRADAGGHYLQIGPTRIPVRVDDAPFVVARVEGFGDVGPLAVRVSLSDGTEEPLAVESVWLNARGVPYCRVKSGRFVARLSVAAWLELASFVEETPGTEEIVLAVGGQRVRISRRDGGP